MTLYLLYMETLQSNLWVEKNSTEQEKNCLNSNVVVPNVITRDTRISLIMRQWKDTAEERKRRQNSPKKIRRRFTDKEPFRWLYNVLILSSKNEEKQLNLTFEDFLTFVEIENCHYCDGHINWCPRSRSVNEDGTKLIRNSQSYFLDRKDNSLGYTKENCVVCCSLCNKIKSNNLSYEEMLLLKDGLQKLNVVRSAKSDKSDHPLV